MATRDGAQAREHWICLIGQAQRGQPRKTIQEKSCASFLPSAKTRLAQNQATISAQRTAPPPTATQRKTPRMLDQAARAA
jgi:hypothetical protein